jgi:hypothetical protein
VNLAYLEIIWLAAQTITIEKQIGRQVRVIALVWISIQELLDSPMNF